MFMDLYYLPQDLQGVYFCAHQTPLKNKTKAKVLL